MKPRSQDCTGYFCNVPRTAPDASTAGPCRTAPPPQDCTGCVYGRAVSHAQVCTVNLPHRPHDMWSQYLGHHVFHYTIEHSVSIVNRAPVPMDPEHFWKGVAFFLKQVGRLRYPAGIWSLVGRVSFSSVGEFIADHPNPDLGSLV